jgi:antitoxin VapB
MANTAHVFTPERSQAVPLPMEFRFECSEIYIRRDAITGDVVLSRKPNTWDGLFALVQTTQVPADFMNESDRNQGEQARDPFDGIEN